MVSKTTPCSGTNLIAAEIAMRVVEAIKKGEDFVAYVVAPASQLIEKERVDRTHVRGHIETVRMMYRLIQEALDDGDSEKSPSDFVVFLCLDRGTNGAALDCAVFDDLYLILGNSLVFINWLISI